MEFSNLQPVVINHQPDPTSSNASFVRFRRTAKQKVLHGDSEVTVTRHSPRFSRNAKQKAQGSDSKVTIPQRTRRVRRKFKPKTQGSDSEVAVPRHTRFRGQADGSRKKSNAMTDEREQLHTEKFFQYFLHIWSTFPEERLKSVACLDPVWFFMYANKNPRVIDWIKQKGTFSKKYILVPIVMWSHWSLLIFCNLGKALCSKTDTPCMLLLDSLQDADGARQLESMIRTLLSDMYKSEGRPEAKQQLKKVPLLVPKVPQQRKGNDCGFYVLHYINLFLESAPENFDISEGYPYFMKEDWFTVDQMEAFCKRLDDVPIASSYSSDPDSNYVEPGAIEYLGHKPGKRNIIGT